MYIHVYTCIYICIYICIYKATMLDRVACEPPQKYPPKCFVRKLFTLLGKFSIWGVDFFDFLVSKNIFNPCLYIEFNTENPNPILKITISFTKTPKKPKHFRKKRKFCKYFGKFQKPKFFKNPHFYFAFCTHSTIRIFYYFF